MRWQHPTRMVHSITFAPKEDLQGGLLNCPAEGCARAMVISCPRHQSCRGELRRDRSGEGGAGGCLPLSGLRARLAGHPGSCHFPGPPA